jgi:hypothetical protein
MAFMDDLRSRLANRVQLTSAGHKAYLEAVEGAFGCDVDYAQLVKIYGRVTGKLQGPVIVPQIASVPRSIRLKATPIRSTSTHHSRSGRT